MAEAERPTVSRLWLGPEGRFMTSVVTLLVAFGRVDQCHAQVVCLPDEDRARGELRAGLKVGRERSREFREVLKPRRTLSEVPLEPAQRRLVVLR
jgi:hypothetical protein